MIDEFTRELMDEVGTPVTQKVAEVGGVTVDQAREAMAALSPVLLGGLKKQQAELGPEGLEALLHQIGASEEKADDMDALVAHGSAAPSSGLALSGLLDLEKEDQTVMALSQKMGVSGSVVRKLLPMLAPIILSMLMKKGQQHSGTNTRASGIGAILDRDGDGQILDDIAGMVLGQMTGGNTASASGGGFLKSILGSLLGRK